MPKNGASTVEKNQLTTDEKLDVLIAGLTELVEKFETFAEVVEEKFDNLNLNNPGYGVDEFGDS